MPAARSFGFLFRTEEGRIGRASWWLGAFYLAVALAAVWGIFLFSDRNGDLSRIGLTGLLFLGSAFVAVCFYFLSAKRLNDRARPRALGLLLPASLFAFACARYLSPAFGPTVATGLTGLAAALLIAAAAWTAFELGIRPAAPSPPASPTG